MFTAIVATSQTIRDFLTAELQSDLNLRNFFNPVFGSTVFETRKMSIGNNATVQRHRVRDRIVVTVAKSSRSCFAE